MTAPHSLRFSFARIRREGILRDVMESFGAALGQSVHDREANLFALGGDSMAAMQCATMLEEKYNVAVRLDLLLTESALGIAEHISARKPKSLQAHWQEIWRGLLIYLRK